MRNGLETANIHVKDGQIFQPHEEHQYGIAWEEKIDKEIRIMIP